MFQKMKDMALSKTATVAINSKIKPYGEVIYVELDTKKHTIELEILLKGEVEALKVFIGKYILKDNNIIISDIITSREWINKLADDYIVRKPFKIPKEYMSVLEKIA